MNQDTLSSTFAALADPTRRAILARLASGEATVNELSEPFELSQPAITKHLKVLEHAGLISRSRAAQTRPAKLEPAGLQLACAWIEEYRRFWETSFDRLDEYLAALQKKEKSKDKPKEKSHGSSKRK
jgi:DNA-binding transcriptional ArsR family regulator